MFFYLSLFPTIINYRLSRMDKKILVLTDFSENAYDAALFACTLAVKKQYSIHLLHYYTVKSSHFDEEEDKNMRDNSHLLKADLEIIELFEKLEAQFPSIKMTVSCKRGLLEEKLQKVLKESPFEMIVLGAKGTSQHQSVFWGTTTAMITEKSTVPVWVVPKGFIHYKAENAGLLTNFKVEELETLKKHVQANGAIDNLNLLHVVKMDENEKDIVNRLESWIVNIKDWQRVKNVNYKIGSIEDDEEDMDTIPEVINHLIKENNLDCILVTKTRRSFFKRLFEKSVSKSLTTQLICPAFFDK